MLTLLYHSFDVSETASIPDRVFKYTFRTHGYSLTSNTVRCAISFDFTDHSHLKNAFTYHFRVWTPLDMKEAMLEAGFKSVHFWLGKAKNAEVEEEEEVLDTDEDEKYGKKDEGVMTFTKHAWTDNVPTSKNWNGSLPFLNGRKKKG